MGDMEICSFETHDTAESVASRCRREGANWRLRLIWAMYPKVEQAVMGCDTVV